MLKEVQATGDVLEAAQKYMCPLCYARKGPKQPPPASALKCTEFNERIQVDSHWILNDDSVIKTALPAPGTPAARRRDKEKAEKIPQGRRCALTVVDHATRYCAIRILNSEKAEEFTKGLERCWLKHFGIPKILRIDEAKGWASKHVREWANSRGITVELQPAEQHSWLGVVERKHQVIRRCLELYQDEVGKHDKASLKEAAVYVPHAVNQLSFHKGFSPQQWVFGKVMTHVHGLSGELFNPGQDALDEQGVLTLQKCNKEGQQRLRPSSLPTLTPNFVELSPRSSKSRRRVWWLVSNAGIGEMPEPEFFERLDGVGRHVWSRLRTMVMPEFFGYAMALHLSVVHLNKFGHWWKTVELLCPSTVQ